MIENQKESAMMSIKINPSIHAINLSFYCNKPSWVRNDLDLEYYRSVFKEVPIHPKGNCEIHHRQKNWQQFQICYNDFTNSTDSLFQIPVEGLIFSEDFSLSFEELLTKIKNQQVKKIQKFFEKNSIEKLVRETLKNFETYYGENVSFTNLEEEVIKEFQKQIPSLFSMKKLKECLPEDKKDWMIEQINGTHFAHSPDFEFPKGFEWNRNPNFVNNHGDLPSDWTLTHSLHALQGVLVWGKDFYLKKSKWISIEESWFNEAHAPKTLAEIMESEAIPENKCLSITNTE